eukprot:5641632-Prymnesium_polylepis.2
MVRRTAAAARLRRWRIALRSCGCVARARGLSAQASRAATSMPAAATTPPLPLFFVAHAGPLRVLPSPVPGRAPPSVVGARAVGSSGGFHLRRRLSASLLPPTDHPRGARTRVAAARRVIPSCSSRTKVRATAVAFETRGPWPRRCGACLRPRRPRCAGAISGSRRCRMSTR